MKTAQEMYKYCLDNKLGQGMTTTWALKHFGVIEHNIAPDEEVMLCFMGLHNYESLTKHGGNFAFAVTNKRIIIAQKKMIGEILQTIFLDNINDITYAAGVIYGVVTVDSIKERFNIAIDKIQAGNINNHLNRLLHQREQQPSVYVNMPAAPRTQPIENDPIEEVKKFKELLDMGIITPEEFAVKKSTLLGL